MFYYTIIGFVYFVRIFVIKWNIIFLLTYTALCWVICDNFFLQLQAPVTS